MRIVSPCALQQCALIANERRRGGFSRNSRRHCRGLSAGGFRQRRDRSWPADGVDRLAWHVMTPAQAAAILVVPSLITNVWQAAVGGGLLALTRRLWPMLAGICIGTVVGVMLLPHDDSGRATVWLGLALVIYAVFGLVKGHFVVPPSKEMWLGLLMGAVTGAITVATGIFRDTRNALFAFAVL